MTAPRTASELIEALGGRWSIGSALARCPAHNDRTPSLSISEGKDGIILVKCFGGCDQAKVIDALRRQGLWPGPAEEQPAPGPVQEHERERDAKRTAEFIDRLWRRTWPDAIPAPASPIETGWLPRRGIDPARLPVDRLPLRWHPRCPRGKGTAPAMVALMTDAITGEPCGIHRTYLMPNGSDKAFGKDSRKMLGLAGVIRLSPDDEVELGIGLCEGIETGLSIMAAGWRPIWVCGSLAGLTKFPVLSGIECLTVFADPKPQEVAGARVCAARWASTGREAIVRIPRGGDFNDCLAA
jgi:putative DNA primase/helicase